jgi:hypothetical protein
MRYALSLLVAVIACTGPRSRSDVLTREPTSVAAPIGTTWDAVTGVFAAHHLPIQFSDRSAGLLTTSRVDIPLRDQEGMADCGKVAGTAVPATRVFYRAAVQGDSVRSSVRVTARWTTGEEASTDGCASTGRMESRLEAEVKKRAEGR